MTGLTRRAAVGAALAALVAAAAGGCGVPTETEVRVDGPVAEEGVTGSDVGPDPPPGPDDATDDRQLVDYFLQAAAADPGDAVEMLRPFIHSEQRDSWRPDPRVMVVRVEDITRTPAGDDRVRFDLEIRRIGVLDDGAIEPQLQEPETVAFTVARETLPADELGNGPVQRRFRIVDPPRFVMLEDRALERYFLPRSLYFWDTGYQVLVPDLRWLPRALPAAQRPQVMLDWLLAGPSPWLDAVVGVPGGVEQVGRAVPGEDTLVIELTAATADVPHRALEAQFWWTLRPELSGDMSLTLVIDGQARQVATGDWPPNLAVWEPPQVFAVVDGEVRAYPAGDASPAPVPALEHGANSQVESAAISQGGRVGALVRQESDGLRLVLTSASGVTETDLRGVGAMSRPVWLREPAGTGLVVADHRLYLFHAREEQVAEVPVPAFMAGRLTAVAAAPDGRRLALIAGGELYVAAMRRDGGLVGLHEPQMLPTTATGLAGVAFSRPDRLVVLGQEDGRYWLYEITVDGGLEERLSFDLGAPESLGNLVAYPGDPERESRRGLIMFEADGRAYEYRQAPEAIRAEEFGLGAGDDDEEEEPSDPRAPFFLE